jgi:hypothetical protein
MTTEHQKPALLTKSEIQGLLYNSTTSKRQERYLQHCINKNLEDFQTWNCLCETFCPTTIQNDLNLMPYFPRIKEMDRVGVEPTTSATAALLKEGSYGKRTVLPNPTQSIFTILVNYCSKMSTFSSGFRTKLTSNAWGKFDIKKFYLMRGYLISRGIMRRLALIVPSLSGSIQYYLHLFCSTVSNNRVDAFHRSNR